MAVCVHGLGKGGMAQAVLNDLEVDAGFDQERRMGMTEGVERESFRHPCLAAVGFRAAGNVFRIIRPPIGPGKEQVIVFVVHGSHALFEDYFFLVPDDGQRLIINGDRPMRRLVFRRLADYDASADIEDRLIDRERFIFYVDVVDAEAQQFGPAQARIQGDPVQVVMLGIRDGRQEAGRLILGQCQHFVMGYSRELDAAERIRRDDAIIDGLAQSDSDHGYRILYRAIAVSLGEQGGNKVAEHVRL